MDGGGGMSWILAEFANRCHILVQHLMKLIASWIQASGLQGALMLLLKYASGLLVTHRLLSADVPLLAH